VAPLCERGRVPAHQAPSDCLFHIKAESRLPKGILEQRSGLPRLAPAVLDGDSVLAALREQDQPAAGYWPCFSL
jgi:hypothetical protein